MDSKIVQVALNGLENILRLGEQESKQNGIGINPYCALIEEAYGEHSVKFIVAINFLIEIQVTHWFHVYNIMIQYLYILENECNNYSSCHHSLNFFLIMRTLQIYSWQLSFTYYSINKCSPHHCTLLPQSLYRLEISAF